MTVMSAPEMAQRFAAMPFPMQNLHGPQAHGFDALTAEAREAIGTARAISVIRATGGLCQMPMVKVGELTCFVGRVTPTGLSFEASSAISIHLAYCGRALFELDRRSVLITPAEGLMFANRGGHERIGFGTGIGFQLSAERFTRTLRMMSGRDLAPCLESGCLWHLSAHQTQGYRTLLTLVDHLLLQDPLIPQVLGLDEQLYRLAAVHQLRRLGLQELLAERASREARSRGQSVLDHLLAYIDAHHEEPLSLTDLECASGYSARRLQQLFHQRFECTPMQYVRRQRLDRARARLDHPQAGDTVLSVARLVGYRDLSQFSADFRHQFGCLPSQVMRLTSAET